MVEEGLNQLSYEELNVTTPTGMGTLSTADDV